jgi:hypothetical protein
MIAALSNHWKFTVGLGHDREMQVEQAMDSPHHDVLPANIFCGPCADDGEGGVRAAGICPQQRWQQRRQGFKQGVFTGPAGHL